MCFAISEEELLHPLGWLCREWGFSKAKQGQSLFAMQKGRHSQSLSPCGSCDMDELSSERTVLARSMFSYLRQPAAQGKQEEVKHADSIVWPLNTMP